MLPYNADFVAPFLGNRRRHGNHFVPHSLGAILMLTPKYEVGTTTQYWVITLFNWISASKDKDLKLVLKWPWP